MTFKLIIYLLCFSPILNVQPVGIPESTFVTNSLNITAYPAQDLTACDTSSNGSSTAPFDLTINNSIIISGQSGASVSYHLNLMDAQSGTAAIPGPNSYTNTTNPQTIYARIQNASGDFDTTSFDLFVNPLPQVSFPNPLKVCDINGNGIATFMLSNSIFGITGNNPDLSVTFHTSNSDAQSQINSLPLNYANTIPYYDAVYVNIEDINTGCSVVLILDLIVDNAPAAFVPDPLTICDVDNDGFGSFTLTSADNQITGGAPGLDVTYHLTTADADNGVNSLTSPFFNSLPYSQTLYARIEDNITNCFNTVDVVLLVNPLPSPAYPMPLEVCDQNGNGFALFDLGIKIPEILNGETNVVITFHETLTDAEDGYFDLTSPYQIIVQNQQTVFVRAENTNTGCFVIITLDLIVNPTPVVPANINPIIICSGNSNVAFDLTIRESEIYGSQSAFNFVLSYYATLSDAENNTNPIQNPSSYFNSNNPETIFISLENLTTGCFTTASFELIVAQLYIDQAPDDIFIDEEDGDGIAEFDLTQNEPLMLGTQNANQLVFSYFASQTDADTNTNTIQNPQQFVNTTNPQTIFVRMEQNLTTDCYLTNSFEIETDEILSNHTSEESKINLYPNPVNRDLHLTTTSTIEQLELFTVNGQRLELPVSNMDNNGKRVDFSGLATGVYLVKITTHNGITIKRVIKQ